MLENMNEVWKDIKGYSDYQISNKGRVWNAKRSRYVIPTQKPTGYMQVNLYADNGRRKKEYVHRLVAMSFIPNPYKLPQVNHIDRVRDNNVVENLEWVTHQENVNKSSSPKKIAVCDLEGNELYRFNSIQEACDTLNLTGSNISVCLKRKPKYKDKSTHKNYTFHLIEN